MPGLRYTKQGFEFVDKPSRNRGFAVANDPTFREFIDPTTRLVAKDIKPHQIVTIEGLGGGRTPPERISAPTGTFVRRGSASGAISGSDMSTFDFEFIPGASQSSLPGPESSSVIGGSSRAPKIPVSTRSRARTRQPVIRSGGNRRASSLGSDQTVLGT